MNILFILIKVPLLIGYCHLYMEGPFNSIFTWNYDNSSFKSILIQFLKKQ